MSERCDYDRIEAKIRSRVDMSNATPADWIYETLAVLEAEKSANPDSSELPIRLHFDFYRDEEGDYILELIGVPFRHISSDGKTPAEAIGNMVTLLKMGDEIAALKSSK